jgi:hypothetical protein
MSGVVDDHAIGTHTSTSTLSVSGDAGTSTSADAAAPAAAAAAAAAGVAAAAAAAAASSASADAPAEQDGGGEAQVFLEDLKRKLTAASDGNSESSRKSKRNKLLIPTGIAHYIHFMAA